MSELPLQAVLIGPTSSDPVSGNRRSICRCVCGKEWPVRNIDFERGRIKSCGCSKYEELAKLNTIHGASAGGKVPREYRIWSHILRRCAHHPDYAGRGITVCPEWATSFGAFLKDMGEAPSSLHSIDRKDNSQGYSPGNCKWSTMTEQNRNKRSNRLLTYQGETHPVIVWTEMLGLNPGTVYARLHRGWPTERALLPTIRP